MSAGVHFAEEYLLNSLWQVPLLFGTAWLVASVLRRLGPAAEHRVWAGALFAQAALPACAAPWLAQVLQPLFSMKSAAEGSISVTLGAVTPHGSGFAPTALRCGAVVYGCVTVLLVLRFAWQCLQLRRLAREATPLLLNAEDALLFEECRTEFGLCEVRLAEAASVRTPVIFGPLRPMLVLPRGFVAEVSASQLRATFSHELAHVARNDAAKHLLYRMFSLAVAYHPVVWLTLSRLAETRERVCDRMAAAATGDARQYAHTLLELASLLTARRPVESHAIGLFDANQLERRILTLNRRSLPLGRSLRIALIAGSAVVTTAACTTAVALHLNVTTTTSLHADPGVKVASGVMAGQVVSRVSPKYPEDAKKAKIQGSVVLAAIIDKGGIIQNLQVVSGPPELQASALEAVRQWVYKPYVLNGQPVDVETTITVNYSLAQ